MPHTPRWTNREWWAHAVGRGPRRRRRDIWRRVGVAGVASGLGAGLMYALDPQTGRRRRHVAYDRGAAALRHTRRRLGRWGRRLSADTRGMARRLWHVLPGQPVAADDQTLVDRVRSVILRNPAVPNGRININVEDGVVVLRGQLDRPEQIQSLVEGARHVPGVRDVVSYLHLPETPAPNKMAAFAAGHDVVVPPPHSGGQESAGARPS